MAVGIPFLGGGGRSKTKCPKRGVPCRGAGCFMCGDGIGIASVADGSDSDRSVRLTSIPHFEFRQLGFG